jgi:hypothetical protein
MAHIDPRILAIVSTLILGITVWLGYAQGGELWPRHWWAILYGLLLIANLFREWWGSRRLSVEPLKELKQELIESCVRTVDSFIRAMEVEAPTGAVRAYAMSHDQKADRLFIEYHSNMGDSPEIDRFRLAPGQGIQGMAFSARAPQYGRYYPTLPITDPRTLGLVELRELIPDNIKWCWAFPLIKEEDKPPFGVLYVDTIADLTDDQASRIFDILRGYANMSSYTTLTAAS